MTIAALIGASLIVVLAPRADAAHPRDSIADRVSPSAAGDFATLAFTGDMLIHNRIAWKAEELAAGSQVEYDFNPMFDQVRSVITAADLAICHQEITLGVPGYPIGIFPRLSAPGEFASAAAGAGYDGCSTASNHSTDYGNAGIESTIGVLDEAGLAHAGTAMTEDQSHGTLYAVGELTLGHLSYTYGVQVVRPDHEWSVGILNVEQIIAAATALKDRGDDFVAVSIHWGNQYQVSPTSSQRSVADALTRSPFVDMIVGHHAHVLQPVETVNGKLVAFGLGNFLSNQLASYSGPNSEDGAVLMVRLRRVDDRWIVWDTEYMPTWVHRRAGDYIIWPVIGPNPEDLSPRYQQSSARRTLKNLTFDGEQVAGMSAPTAIAWLQADPRPAMFDLNR